MILLNFLEVNPHWVPIDLLKFEEVWPLHSCARGVWFTFSWLGFACAVSLVQDNTRGGQYRFDRFGLRDFSGVIFWDYQVGYSLITLDILKFVKIQFRAFNFLLDTHKRWILFDYWFVWGDLKLFENFCFYFLLSNWKFVRLLFWNFQKSIFIQWSPLQRLGRYCFLQFCLDFF